jgi:hypothetical protein
MPFTPFSSCRLSKNVAIHHSAAKDVDQRLILCINKIYIMKKQIEEAASLLCWDAEPHHIRKARELLLSTLKEIDEVNHSRISINVLREHGFNLTIEGCHACLRASVAIAYQESKEFRELIHSAATYNVNSSKPHAMVMLNRKESII